MLSRTLPRSVSRADSVIPLADHAKLLGVTLDNSAFQWTSTWMKPVVHVFIIYVYCDTLDHPSSLMTPINNHDRLFWKRLAAFRRTSTVFNVFRMHWLVAFFNRNCTVVQTRCYTSASLASYVWRANVDWTVASPSRPIGLVDPAAADVNPKRRKQRTQHHYTWGSWSSKLVWHIFGHHWAWEKLPRSCRHWQRHKSDAALIDATGRSDSTVTKLWAANGRVVGAPRWWVCGTTSEVKLCWRSFC